MTSPPAAGAELHVSVCSFDGGPFDGQRKEVRGRPQMIYAAEQPGVDFYPFPSRDPSSPMDRKRHVYVLTEDSSYLYRGIE